MTILYVSQTKAQGSNVKQVYVIYTMDSRRIVPPFMPMEGFPERSRYIKGGRELLISPCRALAVSSPSRQFPSTNF